MHYFFVLSRKLTRGNSQLPTGYLIRPVILEGLNTKQIFVRDLYSFSFEKSNTAHVLERNSCTPSRSVKSQFVHVDCVNIHTDTVT